MDIRMAIAAWPADAPRGAVVGFCRRHTISRSRFYEIRAAALERGLLPAVTSAPRSRPDLAIPAVVAAKALRIRKELAEDGWDHGPITVRQVMLEAGLPAPSRATLARIFTAAGAVVPAPRKRPKSSYRAFVFEKVHECWQLDATEWRLADMTIVVIFQMLDDHSRYILASVVAGGETSCAAVQVMTAAVAAAGQAPVLLLSDNGMAMNPHRRGLTSQLAAHAAELGTRAITSRIYHPQTCGKNERVHSTLKKWLRARPLPASIEELQQWLTVFDEHYNTRRPHQSLGMRTPLQALADPTAVPPLPPDPAGRRAAPDRPADTSPPPAPPPAGTQPQRLRRIPGLIQPSDQMQALRVSPGGVARIKRLHISLGIEHAGSDVLALVEPDLIGIFDLHGTELRTIHPVPGTTYYGTGRPTGGRRRTRINARITPDR